MIRLRLNRAVLTPFLGQFWLANHSMLYIHISRPLPTISVIHIKMFHAWDTFSCFFGFRNTNDTEIKYNNSIHHWHRYYYTNYYCHHDHSPSSSSSSSSLSPTMTPTLLNLRSRSLKVMRGHQRTRRARETRKEERHACLLPRVGTPVAYVVGAWKETRVHERTRHAMETREGRETRVTSRIFWLITIVIIIITINKTTTSMRRKGLKVIRGFYQYFNHYCHHQQQQGPLLAGIASAWKWYRCMKEQGTRWRYERGERQAWLPPVSRSFSRPLCRLYHHYHYHYHHRQYHNERKLLVNIQMK